MDRLKILSGIPVCFEDEVLLIVDKPSGLLSQPGKGVGLYDSLLTRIRGHYQWAELVHRLDRDTSGLLIVALEPSTHRTLSLSFSLRQVEKKYIGICSGTLHGSHGTIVSPLAKIDNQPPRYGAHPGGRISVTQWIHLGTAGLHTRVRLIPLTGRSHQLRVHLHAIDHPLLGDPIYGTSEASRLMLHAEGLAFDHPSGKGRIEISAPCPF